MMIEGKQITKPFDLLFSFLFHSFDTLVSTCRRWSFVKIVSTSRYNVEKVVCGRRCRESYFPVKKKGLCTPTHDLWDCPNTLHRVFTFVQFQVGNSYHGSPLKHTGKWMCFLFLCFFNEKREENLSFKIQFFFKFKFLFLFPLIFYSQQTPRCVLSDNEEDCVGKLSALWPSAEHVCVFTFLTTQQVKMIFFFIIPFVSKGLNQFKGKH